MRLDEEFYLPQELESTYIETIGNDVDDNAVSKVKRWKKGIEHGSSDPMFQDIEAMEAFHLTWDELMALPERVYRSMVRIHGLRVKHEMKEQARRNHNGNNGRV